MAAGATAAASTRRQRHHRDHHRQRRQPHRVHRGARLQAGRGRPGRRPTSPGPGPTGCTRCPSGGLAVDRQALLLPEARVRGGGHLAPRVVRRRRAPWRRPPPSWCPPGTWVTANAVMAGPGSIVGTSDRRRHRGPHRGHPGAGLPGRRRQGPAATARCEETGPVTDADGYYELAPLRAGDWVVEFRDPHKQWADQWSGGGMVEDEAAPVDGRPGRRHHARTPPWSPAAAWRCTRWWPSRAGCSTTRTRSRGWARSASMPSTPTATCWPGGATRWDWVFVLPAGDYFFRFSDCTDPVEYATTWYPGAVEFADAEPIAVAGRGAGMARSSSPPPAAAPGSGPPSSAPPATTNCGHHGRDVIAAGMGDDLVYGSGRQRPPLPGPGQRHRRRRRRARLGATATRGNDRIAGRPSRRPPAGRRRATIASSAAGPATCSSAAREPTPSTAARAPTSAGSARRWWTAERASTGCGAAVGRPALAPRR